MLLQAWGELHFQFVSTGQRTFRKRSNRQENFVNGVSLVCVGIYSSNEKVPYCLRSLLE